VDPQSCRSPDAAWRTSASLRELESTPPVEERTV
jgi:hypothetical protein